MVQTCPSCGSRARRAEQHSCESCGAELVVQAPVAVAPVKAPPPRPPLARRCGTCGASLRAAQLSCEVCGVDFHPGARDKLRLDRTDWVRSIERCVVLGGAGVPFAPGDVIAIRFDSAGLSASSTPPHDDAHLTVGWDRVTRLGIEGPGKITKGTTFVGGGFGLTGIITGVAIAGLLTALSTHSEIITIVHIELDDGELFTYYDALEPHALRMSLSPAFVAQRTAAVEP